MAYSTATTFLQNLTTPKEELPPTLAEIAALVQRIAQRFSDEVRVSRNDGSSQFESAVFGWCPREQKFQIFHIGAAKGAAMSVREFSPKDESEIVLLGSGQEEFWRTLKQFQQEGEPYGRSGRWPKLVVEAMALRSTGNIGGSLSIGIANRARYDLFFWMRPVERGKSAAYFSFNGLNVDNDVGRVGPYTVNMFGMG